MRTPVPCPFCGSIPKVMHGKLTHCSLHGDPAQEIIVKCSNHDCEANPRVSAGDIYNGGLDLAKQAAIEKWNIRSTPAVNSHEELVLALKNARKSLSLTLDKAGGGSAAEAVMNMHDADEILKQALKASKE